MLRIRSVCFWASWIRIRNYFVRIRILPSTSEKLINTLISAPYPLMTFYLWRLMYINVPTERNKQNKLEKELGNWNLGSHWRKEQDPESDPDPSIKCTDPRIRIRIKISRIRNTESTVVNSPVLVLFLCFIAVLWIGIFFMRIRIAIRFRLSILIPGIRIRYGSYPRVKNQKKFSLVLPFSSAS